MNPFKRILCTLSSIFVLGFISFNLYGESEKFQEITVKEGDTLWSISKYYLKDASRWPDILKYNQLPLSDPTIALPGMKIKVPVVLIKEHLRKANLIYVLNDVRSRKKGQSSWEKAKQGMEIYNDDGIRTLEKSQAHVKFYSGDVLKLDENSLVVLRPEEKVEEVNLLTGTLRAMRTKLVTPTAHITPKNNQTVYKAKIREDKATIVHVEKGSAEVLGLASGKKLIVSEGYANITLPNGEVSMPVKVPELPEFGLPDFGMKGEMILPNPSNLNAPSVDVSVPKGMEPSMDQGSFLMDREIEREVRDIKETSPKIAKIKDLKNWKAYRLQIAKDSRFGQVVFDEKREMGDVRSRENSRLKLDDGNYFRRVSFFDDAGKESEFIAISSLEIDTRPPKLSILSPEESFRTREGLVNIEGQAEPGSSVAINNYPVPVKPDGKFTWSVVLISEGANKIRIVARDKLRNKTEMERTIYFSPK